MTRCIRCDSASSLLINVLVGSIALVYNPTHIPSLHSTAVPPLPRTGTTTGSAGQPQLGTGLRTSGTEQQGYKSIEPDLHMHPCHVFALFIQYIVVFCAETAEFSVSSLKRPPAHEVIPPTRDIEEGTTPKGITQWPWVCS